MGERRSKPQVPAVKPNNAGAKPVSNEREPLKMVAVGGTGVGKTYENMRFITNVYSNPKNPNARKTLIYDTNMEFKDILPIAPEDIPLFNRQKKIEVRRVLPLDIKTGRELGMDEKYDLLCDIIDNYGFKNGLLYLEDMNNYVTTANTKHLINLLTTNRHKLMDIFINLQTFGALPPRIWGNVNILRIHKTNDSPFQARIKNQLAGKTEALRIAYIIVDDKTRMTPRFHVTVDFATLKITGQFTIADFVTASNKYLSLNSKMVKDHCKMNNMNEKQAREQLLGNLMNDYNGNVRLKSK
jgi:hypothetical protein